jgi:hypothetical protein
MLTAELAQTVAAGALVLAAVLYVAKSVRRAFAGVRRKSGDAAGCGDGPGCSGCH